MTADETGSPAVVQLETEQFAVILLSACISAVLGGCSTVLLMGLRS